MQTFRDQAGESINHAELECEEQALAARFIRADHFVLELGARYGTVTVAINQALHGAGHRQVAVEPDSRVWEALDGNLQSNGALGVRVVRGFVARQPLALTNLDAYFGGYGATATAATEAQPASAPSYTLEQVQALVAQPFTALVADCEGCLETFLSENPQLYTQLDTLLFEADYTEKCNYAAIRAQLLQHGFRPLRVGFQNAYVKSRRGGLACTQARLRGLVTPHAN